MKITLLSLFLCLAAIAGGDGLTNIPIAGCYCDDNARWQGDVLLVGQTYRLTNRQRDVVDVTMLRGPQDSRLAPLPDGQSITFVATGPLMVVSCRGHQGERVDLRLAMIQPTARVRPGKPPVE